MARLFKRIARVTCWRETIPGDRTKFESDRLSNEQLEITDLHIQFEINKSLPRGKRPKPNTCDITISNLSPKTRSDLETKPLQVQLDAGYEGVPRSLFIGDLRFGMTKLEGSNWHTLLQLGDGSRKYKHGRVNVSHASGATVRTALADTAKSMGLTLPQNLATDKELDYSLDAGQLPSYGNARDRFTDLLSPLGYSWSIQNGKLRVLKENDVHGLTAIPIDEAHGMIGTPEFGSPPRSGKPPHMTVKMLLYPEINPGDLAEVTSQVVNAGKGGLFRIEQVRHRGDTHGSDWETEVELKPWSTPRG